MRIEIYNPDEEINQESCPFLMGCDKNITKHYFINICNSRQYKSCHHYASKAKELDTPISWLQKISVEDWRKESKVIYK
jgi:hypothetical protein